MSPSLLDAKALAALGDLGLVSRTLVDGLMYGVHPSRVPGAGLEFSQYRSYQPGDDLRRVDWKLLARSDRYFVRDADTETSVTVRLVVDASRSMLHEEDGVTKLAAARFLAAGLAALAARQGDALGLLALNDADPVHLPPRREPQQLHRVLHALERLAPAGRWPDWGRLEPLVAGGRGIAVLISDLHQQADELTAAATRLAALRHEVIVLHLLGRGELELPHAGAVTFEDLESGRIVEVDADAIRASYRAAVAADVEATRQVLVERGVDYVRVMLDEPLDRALRRYLQARVRAR